MDKMEVSGNNDTCYNLPYISQTNILLNKQNTILSESNEQLKLQNEKLQRKTKEQQNTISELEGRNLKLEAKCYSQKQTIKKQIFVIKQQDGIIENLSKQVIELQVALKKKQDQNNDFTNTQKTFTLSNATNKEMLKTQQPLIFSKRGEKPQSRLQNAGKRIMSNKENANSVATSLDNFQKERIVQPPSSYQTQPNCKMTTQNTKSSYTVVPQPQMNMVNNFGQTQKYTSQFGNTQSGNNKTQQRWGFN